MKKIICFITLLLLSNACFAAGSTSDGDSKDSLYKGAKKLILRAKKLEKKDQTEKALKLYSKAYDKLAKAYKKDKKNADILNYLGFTLRKAGNFEEAEKFYLAVLKGCKCEEFEELKELIESN